MHELKGFLPQEEGSYSKSQPRYGSYSQNQGSEFSNRMREQKRNLLKEL
jgi:hypothetical protein